MARRKGKIEASIVFTAIVASAAIALALKFIQVIGVGVLIVCVFLITTFAAFIFNIRRKRHSSNRTGQTCG
jgi:Flp pilus assembly protein TadB